MPSTPDEKAFPAKRLFQLRFLILAAAIWHLSVTVAVFALGRYGLLPSSFYPGGLFAPDEIAYQSVCIEIGDILRNQGFVAWATSPTQLHLRFYALPLAWIPRRSHSIS